MAFVILFFSSFFKIKLLLGSYFPLALSFIILRNQHWSTNMLKNGKMNIYVYTICIYFLLQWIKKSRKTSFIFNLQQTKRLCDSQQSITLRNLVLLLPVYVLSSHNMFGKWAAWQRSVISKCFSSCFLSVTAVSWQKHTYFNETLKFGYFIHLQKTTRKKNQKLNFHLRCWVYINEVSREVIILVLQYVL